MKKLTKQHRQNFEPEKLTHKICANKIQHCEKQAKMPKKCTTKMHLLKSACKNQKLAQL